MLLVHIRSGIIMSSSSGIIHSTSIAKPPQKLAAALTHAGCFWMRKPLTVSASYGARDGGTDRNPDKHLHSEVQETTAAAVLHSGPTK